MDGNAATRLWTPAPVAPECLAEVPGLPRPILESGPLDRLPAAAEVLAWGETRAAAAHRRATSPRAWDVDAGNADVPLHRLLWRLRPAAPAVVAEVHHRGFALGLAERFDCRLAGAAMVASTADLEARLRSAQPRRWVVKAPFSAAGRERYRGRGTAGLEGAEGRRVAGLFERHGELLFEPWMERTDDFGVVGICGGDGARMIGFHRSLGENGGRPLGLELKARYAGPHDLAAGENERLAEVFEAVGRTLARHGYAGPFGIDCWRHLDAAGGAAWNPLGELNARMTLGLVARVLVDRVREPLGLAPSATVRLSLGTPAGRTSTVKSTRTIPLLLGPSELWLEVLHKDLPGDELLS